MEPALELQMLRAASRASRTGAWRWDIGADRVTWSQLTYELFEVAPGTPVDYELALSFYADADRERLDGLVARCIEDGTPWEVVARCRTRSGRWFWARSHGQLVRDGSGAVVALEGSFQDITREESAKAAVALANDEIAALMETMPDGFFALDEDWRFVFVNGASRTLLHREPEDLLGANIWEEYPDAIGTRFESVYRNTMQTGRSQSFTEFFEPLGTWFAVVAHRWPRGLLVHFRDVTEEKTAEQKRLQTERMALLGQMAGGVSHDFNNVLSVILGNVELLDMVDGAHERAELIAEVRKAIGHGKALNDSLMAYAGRARLDAKTQDLAEFLEGMRPILQRAVPSEIVLRFDLHPEVPPIELDATMAESCVLNLVLNARDAIDGAGGITVSLSRAEERGRLWVRLGVADTGPGIPPDLREKVFEPFFTTKGLANGSGLGLSRVAGFAEQSGGFARVEHQDGPGTVVAMYFPIEIAADTLRPAVLVVDDTPAVARVTARMLEQMGFAVEIADSAEAARAVLDSGSGFRALVTDVVMPGESGLDFACDALDRYPDMGVIVMSGYQGRIDEQTIEGIVTLRKPVSLSDLREALGRVGAFGTARGLAGRSARG